MHKHHSIKSWGITLVYSFTSVADRNIWHQYKQIVQVPGAVRSKAWLFGCWVAGIAGSNPVGGMDACVLWALFVVRYRYLRAADQSIRGVLPSVVCLDILVKSQNWGGLGPRGLVSQGGGWGGRERTDLFYWLFLHLLNIVQRVMLLW